MPDRGSATPAAEDDRLGRAIAARRSELGWKRNDLVREAEISYPYLAEIENGRKMPSGGKLRAIAQALGLTEAELFQRAEDLPLKDADVRPARLAQRPNASDLARAAADDPQTWDMLRVPSAGPGPRSAPLDRRLEEAITAIVRAELSAWARYELPGLIRAELEAMVSRREA